MGEAQSRRDGITQPGVAHRALPRGSVFNGLIASGSWMLFVSDLSSGSEATVLGWGLEITTAAVPEPESLALCGVLLVAVAAGLRMRNWKVNRPPA